jgi:hypothetical protein
VVADHGGGIDGGGSSNGPADEVVAEIEAAGGAAVACCASVSEEAGADAIVAAAVDTYGGIDVLINNAGISDPGAFDELTVAQFRRMIEVHYFGTLLCTRAAWPHMQSAGYGRIVFTMSESVTGGVVEQTSYAAAKGAVLGLLRSLATETHGTDVRVNAVVPRAFTRMAAAHSFADKSAEELAWAQRVLAPELNAPAAVFLSHESCTLNGELLRSGMGSIARIAMIQTKGLAKDDLSVEDIAEHLADILDVTDATVAEAKPFTS